MSHHEPTSAELRQVNCNTNSVAIESPKKETNGMGVFKRGKNGSYHFEFVLDGVRHRGTTGRKNKNDAQGVETEYRAELTRSKREREQAANQFGCAPEHLGRFIECQRWFDGRAAVIAGDGQELCNDTCRNNRRKRQISVPTLAQFCRERVEPWARSRFETHCPGNWHWYRSRLRAICAYAPFANLRIDEITSEHAAEFAAHEMTRSHLSHITRGKKRKNCQPKRGLAVSTVNTSLRALRRVLRLAVEWGLITAMPKIKLMPGEQHRERVITEAEENKYVAAAAEPLASIATVLANTGLRPEECYRLQWEHIGFESLPRFRFGSLFVAHGKTKSARRRLPLTQQVRQCLETLWDNAKQPETGWVFPAPTKSGHVDHSTVRKQHLSALKLSGVRPFVLYSFRHTFLTRLGEAGVDVFTLARIAGHSSIQMSAKYVHPSEDAMLTALAKLQQRSVTEDQVERQLPPAAND
jgi:integrase